jgi:tetratricopeptide (TPR) repeat protein
MLSARCLVISRDLDRYKKAKECYKGVIKPETDVSDNSLIYEAMVNHLQAYVRNHKTDEYLALAKQELDKCFDRKDESLKCEEPVYYLLQAILRKMENKENGYIYALRDGLTKHPFNPYLNLYGQLAGGDDKDIDSLKPDKLGTNNFPKGLYYYFTKEKDKAIYYFNKVLKINEDDYYSKLYIARLLTGGKVEDKDPSFLVYDYNSLYYLLRPYLDLKDNANVENVKVNTPVMEHEPVVTQLAVDKPGDVAEEIKDTHTGDVVSKQDQKKHDLGFSIFGHKVPIPKVHIPILGNPFKKNHNKIRRYFKLK